MQPSLEDYRVQLDCYAGPLDLLLYLVKRHEIELYDLPIAKLTEQYLEHLKVIQEIDVNLAGEFLVMAATLLEIKSQMLLPRPEGAEAESESTDELDQGDPRYELVQQLLAYKRFKDAAIDLDDRRHEWERRFPVRPSRLKDRGSDVDGDDAEAVEFDLEDMNVLDLCEAFARILDSIGQAPATHDVTYDDTPIELHAEDIFDRLTRDGQMTLQQIFVGRHNRSEMVGLFLATLELVRQKKVAVLQDKPGGNILLSLRPAEEQLQAEDDVEHDWRDPETGEVQYEWPSEEVRLRVEKRAKIRASRARNRQFDKADEDDVIMLDDDHSADFDDDLDDQEEAEHD